MIFGAAGATGNGAILTATQSGKWGIGVDTDQYATLFMSGTVPGSNKLLSSALKRLDNAVYDAIKDVVDNAFTSGQMTYHLSDDGVSLAPFHEADPSVPTSVRNAIEVARLGIISGAVNVNNTCRMYVYLPLIKK